MNVRREWLHALVGAASAAWLVCLAVGVAMLLGGCASEAPRQGIYLGRGVLRVNHMTNETDNGTPLDEFHCGEALMWCDVFGSTKECRCVARQ